MARNIFVFPRCLKELTTCRTSAAFGAEARVNVQRDAIVGMLQDSSKGIEKFSGPLGYLERFVLDVETVFSFIAHLNFRSCNRFPNRHRCKKHATDQLTDKDAANHLETMRWGESGEHDETEGDCNSAI